MYFISKWIIRRARLRGLMDRNYIIDMVVMDPAKDEFKRVWYLDNLSRGKYAILTINKYNMKWNTVNL